MNFVTITEARNNLFKLVESVHMSHKPVTIRGKKNDVVMVDAEDWSALQETLYLTSIPGMKESIIEGMKTPIEECVDELPW